MAAADLQISENSFLVIYFDMVYAKLHLVWRHFQHGNPTMPCCGRSLACEGQKKVDCVVQSVSSTTHSYTIQSTVTANGRLLSPLFIILKEKDGQFGSTVEKTLFTPTNVYVKASKSGKVTSGITLIFNHDNYSYGHLNNN